MLVFRAARGTLSLLVTWVLSAIFVMTDVNGASIFFAYAFRMLCTAEVLTFRPRCDFLQCVMIRRDVIDDRLRDTGDALC